MNTYTVDDDTIATLTGLIPTDYWLMPSLDAFAQYLPLGGTDRGLSLRLRSAMGLPPGGRRRSAARPVIVGSPRGRTDIIARANCRLHDGDRYLWRRYLPGTDHAEIERDAAALIKQVHRAKLDQGDRVEQAPLAHKGPSAPVLLVPAAPPPRPASTVSESMAVAEAWDFLRARMLLLEPDLLRCIVADATAERERRREALQAELARLG